MTKAGSTLGVDASVSFTSGAALDDLCVSAVSAAGLATLTLREPRRAAATGDAPPAHFRTFYMTAQGVFAATDSDAQMRFVGSTSEAAPVVSDALRAASFAQAAARRRRRSRPTSRCSLPARTRRSIARTVASSRAGDVEDCITLYVDGVGAVS